MSLTTKRSGVENSASSGKPRLVERDESRVPTDNGFWNSRRTLYIIAVTSLVFYTIFIIRTSFVVEGTTYFTLFDDAMISMRYAQNFSHGHGLIWNPGERPVEGYTNLLWTLWMALLHLLPIPESKIALVVMLSGIIVLWSTALLTASIVRQLAPELKSAPPVAAALVTFYYPLAFWTLRGMEVGLLACVLAASVDTALRLRDALHGKTLYALALLLVVGLLTRTDFIIPAVLISGFVMAGAPRDQRVRAATVLVGAMIITLAAHTIFRAMYYGDMLPNTYRLKIGGFSLGHRLMRGSGALINVLSLPLGLPLAAAMSYLLTQRRRQSPAVLLLAATVACQFMYSVYVGGDAWEWMGYANRYVATATPTLFALATLGLFEIARRIERRLANPGFMGAAPGLILLIGLAINSPMILKWGLDNAAQLSEDQSWARYGLLLRQATPPGTHVAVSSAGAITYFSRRPTVDMLGKSDAFIAALPPQNLNFPPGHMKWDYEYSIHHLRPELVAQLFSLTKDDVKRLKQWGYVAIFPSVAYARSDAAGIDRARIQRFLIAEFNK